MKELSQLNFAPNGGFTGFGPLGNPQGSGIDTFTKFISTAIGVMTLIAFIWFVFLFVTGAIGIMTAGGDKAGLENARKKIVNGIIGLVVVIAAVSIISLVGSLVGVNILDLPGLFNQITQ